jgi:hypothetical protein
MAASSVKSLPSETLSRSGVISVGVSMNRTQHGFHPNLTRRTAVQAGAFDLLGPGMKHFDALRAAAVEPVSASETSRSCIYI